MVEIARWFDDFLREGVGAHEGYLGERWSCWDCLRNLILIWGFIGAQLVALMEGVLERWHLEAS